jgi:hypothetical protein
MTKDSDDTVTLGVVIASRIALGQRQFVPNTVYFGRPYNWKYIQPRLFVTHNRLGGAEARLAGACHASESSLWPRKRPACWLRWRRNRTCVL